MVAQKLGYTYDVIPRPQAVNHFNVRLHRLALTATQCRAARALLEWSQADLEKAAKVAKKTIADLERGIRQPYERTLDALQAALEAAGVEFIPENGGGAGVRMRKNSTGESH